MNRMELFRHHCILLIDVSVLHAAGTWCSIAVKYSWREKRKLDFVTFICLKEQEKIGYLHSVCKGYTEHQGLRAWHRRGTCVILVKEETNRVQSESEEQVFDEHRSWESWKVVKYLFKCGPYVGNLILIFSVSLPDQRAG